MSALTWEEVARLVTGVGSAHLATARPDGTPHVATVWAGVEGERLWFATMASSRKAADLRANPQVALAWAGNGAETYVWGRAELLADQVTRHRLWHGGILPYDPAAFFGSPDNPDLAMVRVTPTRATVLRAGPDGPGRERWRA